MYPNNRTLFFGVPVCSDVGTVAYSDGGRSVWQHQLAIWLLTLQIQGRLLKTLLKCPSLMKQQYFNFHNALSRNCFNEFFSEPLRLTCPLWTSSPTPCMVSSLLAVQLTLFYSRNVEHFNMFCHPCNNQIQKSCHLQGELFIARIQLKLTVSQSLHNN